MSDAIGAAEALLGLPGFLVLEVHEDPGDEIVVVELAAETVGCPGCGVVARSHGRAEVDYRDLACFGGPARLRWRKRRFRCKEPACAIVTWSEASPEFSARCLLTDRAGLEYCVQVGLNARSVAQMARETRPPARARSSRPSASGSSPPGGTRPRRGVAPRPSPLLPSGVGLKGVAVSTEAGQPQVADRPGPALLGAVTAVGGRRWRRRA